MDKSMEHAEIKAIIGLGNPGPTYKKTRHNIGFMLVDELAQRYGAHWQHKDMCDIAHINLNGQSIMLIKPLTFMNTVGKIVPMLTKKGIAASQILVAHDELEKPLGVLQIRLGGSARGHNGLRSIIQAIGQDFYRLRFGVGRPERKEDVAHWVLSNFEVDEHTLQTYISKAVDMINSFLAKA